MPTWRGLSLVLLVVLSGVDIYRAATQSITVDEAFHYNHYLSVPPDSTAKNNPYNENLNSILGRVSIKLFGSSEFAIRLPAVLGGFLCFYALFRLCWLLFGDTPWLLFTIGLNSLNPFLLDYFSAARGYGLGIAFWTWGMYAVARYLQSE